MSTEVNGADSAQNVEIPDYMVVELGTDTLPEFEPADTGLTLLPEPVVKEVSNVMPGRCQIIVEGMTFVATTDRLYLQTQRGDKIEESFVSSLIVVVAVARDKNGSSWGKVVRFEDQDGIRKELYIPNQDITTDSSSVIRRMVKEGLIVSTQRCMVDALVHFLNLAPPNKTEKAECTDRIGWHDNVYLFHDNSVIGKAEKTMVYTGSPIGNSHATKGTLQSWKDKVAALCQGNSLLILAVCVSFASVLIRLLRAESCGYHYFGESSTGKSTSLYVGASVHGEPDSMFGSWNTTVAGMEGRSKKYTDSLLINDELHESNAKDAGKIIYMIMNGKGRQRSNVLGEARDIADWRLNCLSSGEVSSEDFIRSNGGNPRAGQAVRMLDIYADMGVGFGVFENIHGAKSSQAFAEQIKEASLDNYGTPIREFLHKLTGRTDRLDEQFSGIRAKFFEEFVPEESSSQVKRVASKMAVAAMAGELATVMKLTGWAQNEALTSIGGTFVRWLGNRGTTGQQEAEIGVEQAQNFLQRHGMSRFAPVKILSNGQYVLDGPERPINNMAGFRVTIKDGDGDLYEFIVRTETYVSEMCQGLIPKKVTETLLDRGYLHPDHGDKRAQARRRMPGYKQARYYHFTTTILSDIDEFEPAEAEEM